jgi:hypothetical protein
MLVIDVRADRNFNSSELRAEGALRISADHAAERLAELDVPRRTWIIAFCA